MLLLHSPTTMSMSLTASCSMRSSFRALSSLPSTSRAAYLPLPPLTRFASSVSEHHRPTASSSTAQSTPLLGNQPPVVEPTPSPLPAHQTPPPPPARPARAAPRIRASKAALTLVRTFSSSIAFPHPTNYLALPYTDIRRSRSPTKSPIRANTPTDPNRRAQQRVCRHAVPSRIRRKARKV